MMKLEINLQPFFNEIPAWVQKMAEQITTFDEANVIIVNWLDGVRTDYDHARRNARRAGEQVAEWLNCLFVSKTFSGKRSVTITTKCRRDCTVSNLPALSIYVYRNNVAL